MAAAGTPLWCPWGGGPSLGGALRCYWTGIWTRTAGDCFCTTVGIEQWLRLHGTCSCIAFCFDVRDGYLRKLVVAEAEKRSILGSHAVVSCDGLSSCSFPPSHRVASRFAIMPFPSPYISLSLSPPHGCTPGGRGARLGHRMEQLHPAHPPPSQLLHGMW